MDKFKLVSEYKPSGDQPEAIQALVNGVNSSLIWKKMRTVMQRLLSLLMIW